MTDSTDPHEKPVPAAQDSKLLLDLFMRYMPGYAYVTDEDDRLVYANDQLREQLGQGESLVGRQEAALWPAELVGRLKQAEQQVRQTGSPAELSAEIMLDGEPRTFATFKFAVPIQDNPLYIGTVFRDITDFTRSETASADSESRFSLFMAHFPGFAYIKDNEGRFVFANQSAQENLLQVYGGAAGEADYHRWPPQLAAEVIADDQLVRTAGEPIERVEEMPFGAEVRRLLTVKFPIPRQGKSPLIGAISQDITERVEAEEELAANQERLRALVAQLVVTEEQERHRLAGEIHDNLSQTLVVAKMKTQLLSQDAGTESLKLELAGVIALLDEAIANTRSVTFDLSPPVLYQVGFEAALVWLGRQTQERHQIAVHLDNDDLPKPLTDEGRAILFQVVRELFANLVKHAHAQNVWVRLRADSGMLAMELEDDGVGFDPERATWTAKQTAGFGLFSIRERIEYLHGTVEIKSEIGKGTRATMTVPLAVQS